MSFPVIQIKSVREEFWRSPIAIFPDHSIQIRYMEELENVHMTDFSIIFVLHENREIGIFSLLVYKYFEVINHIIIECK